MIQRCPNCGATEGILQTTAMPLILPGVKDNNKAACGCGWKGRVDDLVPDRAWRMRHERRLRIYTIEETRILDLLRLGLSGNGEIVLPRILEIPSNASLLKVSYSFERQCFMLLVWDASFDEISPGSEVRFYPGHIDWMTCRIISHGDVENR